MVDFHPERLCKSERNSKTWIAAMGQDFAIAFVFEGARLSEAAEKSGIVEGFEGARLQPSR